MSAAAVSEPARALTAPAERPHVSTVRLVILAAFGLVGCIRDLGELRTPAEGAALTGEVAERDLRTGELVPKSGVRVRVRAGSASVVTGEDGRFVLARLPLGDHEVVAERRDARGAVVAARRRRATLVTDGQAQDLGRLVLSLDGTLAGLVVAEGPDVPGGRAPADGALVAVPGTPYQAVATGSGFFLPNLPPGSYDLAAFYPGRAPGLRFGLELPEGQQVVASEIVLGPAEETPVPVAGRVSLEGEGAELAGTDVRFFGLLGGGETSATTEAEGRFSVELSPGLYRARFDRDGYIPAQLFGIAVLPGGVAGLEPVHLARTLPGDLDGDGVPDVIDPDIDGDGCPNATDDNPRDPLVCRDTDGDGIPDEIDPDIDGDTLSNAEEDSLGLDGWITDPRNPDTDGDGIPDAEDPCPTVPGTECGAAQADVPLVLTGFAPERVATGEALETFGRGFDPSATLVRFTGDDALIPALSATATRAVVRVPTGASSGPVRVYARGQEAVGRSPVEVFQRPTVTRVLPRIATVGSLVAVYLTGVDPEQSLLFRLDDAPPQAAAACGEPQRAAALTGELVVCVEPDRRASRIRLLLPGATVDIPLVVQEGPSVTRILPNPAAPGAQLRLLGRNLDAAEDVRVRFPGVEEPVTADRVTAVEIVVTVPSGALPGALTVLHPALEFRTSAVLDLDTEQVLATDLSPLYLTPGDRDVLLTGSNLDRVTEILLPDDSPADNMRVLGTTGLRFDVSAAFRPTSGPITLVLADGSRVTSQVSAGAVQALLPVTLQDNTANRYVPLSGQRLAFVTFRGEIVVLDFLSGSLSTRPTERINTFDFPIPRTSRVMFYQAVEGRDAYTVLDLTTGRLGPTALAERAPETSSIPQVGSEYYAWLDPDLLVVARTRGGTGNVLSDLLVIDPRDGTSRSVLVPEMRIVLSVAGDGRDVVLIGTFVGRSNTGWATVNVDPSDGIPDGTLVRGPATASALLGEIRALAERRGDGMLIVSTTGVELSRPEANRRLFRWPGNFNQGPSVAGGRFYVHPEASTGRGCSIFDAVLDRPVAEIPSADSFSVRCFGTGPRPVVAVVEANQVRGFELLPP